jgi:hypothetical protein
VIALPNYAVADAHAGDAMSGAVSEDDAHYSRAPLHEGDSLIPDPHKILALQTEGPKIVRCRWCPSARCAEHDLRDLRRERKRVADAIILTTRSRARLSERLKQRAHRSRFITSCTSVVSSQRQCTREAR